MKCFEVRKCERGISLIALVITIIVIVILAAIAFNSSTSTIGKANYSKFVSNVSEVEQTINEKMIEVKGAMLAKGSQITDGQAFNYVAKGGKTDDDFVVESRTPDYTIIEKSANIGIKLPVMRVNTPTETNVEVKYAVTKNGKVFVWPPFPSENTYNIRNKEFIDSSLVSSSGDIDITVASSTFKIQINENSKLENRELLDDGLSRKEFEKITSKIKVGDYVNYIPTTVQNVETDSTKTGSAKQTFSTDATAKWRILSIDSETGKVMITTEGAVNDVSINGASGYLYGVSELHRLCGKLYSNRGKNLIAKSMTIDELNKSLKYKKEDKFNRRVYYPYESSDTPDVIVNGEKYIGIAHGRNIAKFYTYDNSVNGKEETSNDILKYKFPTVNVPVLVTDTFYLYNPSKLNKAIGEILGNDMGWLASPTVYIGGDYVGYDLRHVSSSTTSDGFLIFDSFDRPRTCTYGLRPVVSFNANKLDVSNTLNNGLSSSTAWNIK